jgi:hypothetical protein
MHTLMNRPSASNRRRLAVTICTLCLASVTAASAHVVRGLRFPTLATAFVSSPSAAADAPIPVVWGGQNTGLSVACFNVANTSIPRADRQDSPRVMGVGVELPGTLSGFALVSPLDGAWQLKEDIRAFLPGHGAVTLDFALVARDHPRGTAHGREGAAGIPPGQTGVRGAGTRFCVSGPFPAEITAGQATTIEQIVNGVVVVFHAVEDRRHGFDAGVWDNAARVIPLFPE